MKLRVATVTVLLAGGIGVAAVFGSGTRTAGSHSGLFRPARFVREPAAPGTVAGTGIMALGCSLGKFAREHLDSFAYLIVSKCDDAAAAALPGRVLQYFNPIMPNDQFDNGEVTVATARAKGWLLKDSAGREINVFDDPHQFLTDPGNTAFQQATVQALEATLARFPSIRALEIDNALPNPAYFNPNGRTWPAEYPNTQAWQDVTAKFVTVVGKALRRDGLYVLVNATGYNPTDEGYNAGQFDQAWYARLARTGAVDAILAEYWVQNPNEYSQLMDDSNPGSFMTSWSGWQQLESICQQNGVDFFADMAGPDPAIDPATARHVARYGRGSFLLGWERQGGVFFYAVEPTYGGADSWGADWTTPIGTPVGGAAQLAKDVWYRPYTAGWVLVNAGPDPWNGKVNGTAVTVPARDAVIRAGAGKPGT